MRLVDTHCHLQDAKFDDDREAVLARALEILDWIVVIGDDLASSRRAVDLTQDRVYAAVGIHPYHARGVDEDALDQLRAMTANERVVALGEFGLDYFKYCDVPHDIQHAAFHAQLELAAELKLPVVIHNRESQDDVCAIIEEHHRDLAGGIMHCFAGDPAFVERCISWGFHVSFAGNVSFPKASELREAAIAVPMDRLLVETDSPYLAPQPRRGTRCEPTFVQYTAETLAEVKGVSIEELTEATSENAVSLFGIQVAEA
jgi:TatD DNase family protein